MRVYVLRRIAQSAVTLLGVSVLVFVILRVMPGDPARMAARRKFADPARTAKSGP